jgi:hypothetical protein
MREQLPVLDLFIGRDGDAWRLYLAPGSWVPGLLAVRVDEHREVHPVAKPDAEDLDRFMFDADAPYGHRRTSDGGMEIIARGRSAICLLIWLEEIVKLAPVRALRT